MIKISRLFELNSENSVFPVGGKVISQNNLPPEIQQRWEDLMKPEDQHSKKQTKANEPLQETTPCNLPEGGGGTCEDEGDEPKSDGYESWGK